jgi:hypothetical protein
MEDNKKLELLKGMFSGASFQNSVVVGLAEEGSQVFYQKTDEKTENPKITMTSELLRQTVPCIQDRFWGNSSHAVVFCCCRDFYNYPNNMSQYERDMADPQNSLRLNYVCPEGTLAMAFANNPFLKLHVDKWKEFGVKSRVLKLVEEFRGKIEASNPDIRDDIK